MREQPKSKSAVYGPFEMTSLIGSDVQTFLTLPYADVINSTAIFAIVQDNSLQVIVEQSQLNCDYYGIIHIEAGVFGSVQGYQTLLKRQAARYNWGPMLMHFSSDDVYDQVVFKARMFVGGKPGIPRDIVFTTDPAGNVVPLSVQAVVNVVPRVVR